MPSDYEAITTHNERQLGLDTASRKTQICMYSDSTHFVYEILQNADDHGATEVFFKLSKDELLIEHNGEPFIEKNVEAITYFGKSTSRDDLIKAGRFGVGFKSVFAFTATPVIISGNEHFQIYGLYRIKEYPYPDSFSRSRTRIVLPFNHEQEQPDYVDNLISRAEAYSKISTRLTGMNMNTLLFTQNIREIRWEIDGRSGNYLREDSLNDGARWTTITDGDQLNKYLVFSRVPQWKNREYKAVEISFAVDDKNQLLPINDCLYVLFATTQETHLQFILNGPYRTNPSRETISEEDHFNMHLMKETCALMKDVLPQLRDKGLLTALFLAVLPNINDMLRDFYKPLLDAIIETFREHELVPTDDNRYACAGDVLQGPALLREVITREELAFFLSRENACWAKGVQQNQRSDHFLRALGIQQWGWEQLQKTLANKFDDYSHDANHDGYAWLAARSDSWLQKLYILLAEAIKRGECSEWTLKRCNIIRVLKGSEEIHVTGSKAYFPKGRSYKDLPQVKRTILFNKNQQATQKIQESLVTLGVSEIGDEERIDILLETFYGEESAGLEKKEHFQHLNTFIKWWKKEKNADKFKDIAFYYSSEKGKLLKRKPAECYLESPIRKSGLDVIYKDKNCNLRHKWKLWSGYRDIANEDFCSFAIDCGVEDGLIIEKQLCYRHPNRSFLRQDYEQRAHVKLTNTSIDDDYTIKGLSDLLQMKNRNVSLLIWRTVSKAAPEVLGACFRPNQQYTTRKDKSSLIIALTKAQWIPNKGGHLHKPCDLIKEQLHQDFKFDNLNGWLDEIGFGENANKASEEYKRRKEMSSFLGLPVEIPDYFSTLSDIDREKEAKEFIAYIKHKEEARKHAQHIQQENVPFHEAIAEVFLAPGSSKYSDCEAVGGASHNPSHRRARISENIAAAIESEGKPEARFSFTMTKKWKGKNDQVRVALAKWYSGQCQICRKTFTQRSGEPYFEGLYLVPYTVAEWLDRVGNVLCLCAWHSAMFQFGSKEIDEDIIQQVMRFKTRAEGGNGNPMIRMKLCGEAIEIEFAENHLIDLQEMISASQSTKSSGKQ